MIFGGCWKMYLYIYIYICIDFLSIYNYVGNSQSHGPLLFIDSTVAPTLSRGTENRTLNPIP